MNTDKKEMTMKNADSNPMRVSEFLFGCIMATASIYAAWCAVSLIRLVV